MNLAPADHPWLLPVLALLAGLSGLALWAAARGRTPSHSSALRRRFDEAFGGESGLGRPEAGANWLETLGNRLLLRRRTTDNEVIVLLARPGWNRKADLSAFLALQALMPVLAGLIASHRFIVGGINGQDWAILFLACAAGWLLPKRILAYRAAVRQQRIAEQTPVLVQLLRVLLGTGLSVEQALRSLVVDTRELLPDIAFELDFLLRRIDAGEDIAFAMRSIALQMDVPALTDLTMLLDQTWRMGGNVQKSLAELSHLIEDRMQTDMKEKVSKLSGKMTIVMMLFLFPALLVFLAAPGFLAIIKGLKNVMG